MALTTVPASLSATALTLTTAAQPNITSVGTLTGLTVSGNIAGTLTTAAQTNITSVGTLSSLAVTGTVTGGNATFSNLTVSATEKIRLDGAGGHTFIQESSNDTIVFATGGSTRLTLDANATFSGTVGIGAAPHATAPLNITTTNQHIRLNNGSELGVISLDSDGKLDLWAHGDGETIGFRTGTGSGTVAMSVVGTNVGIGTSAPLGKLSVGAGSINDAGLPVQISTGADGTQAWYAVNRNGAYGALFGYSASSTYKGLVLRNVVASGTSNADGISFMTNNTAMRMHITGAGNVGIGTSSPNTYTGQTALTVNSSGVARLDLDIGDTMQGFLLAESGYTGLFTPSGSNSLRFGTNNTEAYRITAARDMYFGQTSGSAADVGHIMQNNGVMFHTADGTTGMYLRRKTSDGDILEFRKDSTTVGTIGTVSGSLYIASPYANDSGLRFSDRTIHPCTTSGAPRDDAINLGYSAGRFDTVYAKAGSINTSDRNEKQNIELLSDAEMRVAKAAKGLLRKYRWKSAVAEKGDDARIHFGIIAQDLQAAFEAEGLDAAHYGMWCSDTWTDDDGSEQTRLGVRYSELLAFIIAAI